MKGGALVSTINGELGFMTNVTTHTSLFHFRDKNSVPRIRALLLRKSTSTISQPEKTQGEGLSRTSSITWSISRLYVLDSDTI